MTEPREIELKFDADPDSADRLRERLTETIGTPRDVAHRLTSTYFDTRKKALRRRGLSLRVRDDGEGHTQTLKGSANGGGFARSELRPVFVTDITRTVWDVRHGRSQIEVALDSGAVSANGDVTRLTEVELELKDGTPSDLFRLAQDLAAQADLRIGVQSKSERGYDLVSGAPQGAVHAGPVRLDADMTAGQAFQTVARACLRQFRLNERILLETRDADALHQARVGIRRLRSALTLFKPVVADDRSDRMRTGLKDVSQHLGEARNLDVYRAHVASLRDTDAPNNSLAAYEAHVAAAREDAYEHVQSLLGSADFRLFVVDLAGWIETGMWTQAAGNVARDEPLGTFAPDVLRKRRRAVRKRGKHLVEAAPEDRHQLRIAAKKLRYACEFFEALAGGRKARASHRAFTGRLEDLQEQLGALNDLRTGDETAQRLAGDPASDVAFPAGLVTGGDDAQEAKLLRKAKKTFARVAKAQTPLAD